MKTIPILSFSFVAVILSLISNFAVAQTNTVAAGNWNTASNWSAGVPSSGSTITVNHAMTIDVNINANGDYTIAKTITDAVGGTAYTLDVNDKLDMTAQGTSIFEGALNVNNGGKLTIESGDTLIVGPNSDFANNSQVEIKAGGVLVVNGDLKNDNNSQNIKVDGAIIVLGDFKGWNGSKITGTGSIQTTGSLTYQGSGQTFGNTTACNAGPCGSSQFCIANAIAASQSICAGSMPAGLTGNLLSGYTYQWQQSTSFYSGFVNVASSGIGQNYSPGVALSTTTYYRRKVSNGTSCTVYSIPVTITVNPTSASVSISSNVGTSICSGTSVTFTAAPTNGGSSPAYQWKVNAGNVGSNAATYTTSSLTNGQIVTCVLTSNAACVSPTTATSNALTMSVNAVNTWMGTTSSAWAAGSNWCGGAAPTSSKDVTIPGNAVNMPLVSTAVNVRNITINASARVNVSAAGTLNIYGNYTNNGTYYDLGTTAFVGSGAQSINGIADSLNNLTIQNSAGVTINAATYVKKYLTLMTGALTTNDKLTVDIYFGAILGIGTGSITGNVTVVRTIWSDKWHYISSPLNGKTVADWNTIVPVKFGANANLYFYDETNTSSNQAIGWSAIGSTATPINSMKGYSLYFPRGIYKTNFSITGGYTHTQTYTNAALSNTASGVPSSDGWNLVGNPYPSEIDWDAVSGWTKIGLDNSIYFFDQVNNRYASYASGTNPVSINGGTRYIPSMQGFYVKVTNPGTGTLGMTKNVRSAVVNRDNWRVASEQQMIRLTATSGNFSDETVVRLHDEATDAFDSQWDAYKLMNTGSTPNISTALSGTNFSINSISSSTLEKTIPVKLIANVAGIYSITADITGFEGSAFFELEDKALAVHHNLSADPVYTVTLAAGDTTTRLFLHYKNTSSALDVTDTKDGLSNEGLSITAYQQQISINFNQQMPSEASVYVCDVIGNRIFTLENTDSSSGRIECTLPSASNGVYLVKVVSSAGSKTQRVYLTK
jgi:hypothetical protein